MKLIYTLREMDRKVIKGINTKTRVREFRVKYLQLMELETA